MFPSLPSKSSHNLLLRQHCCCQLFVSVYNLFCIFIVSLWPHCLAYPDLNVLLGGSAQLPCDLSPSGQLDPVMEHDDRGDIDREDDDEAVASSRSRNTSKPTEAFNADSIQLILWYHGDDISGSPFYSVDARSANDNKMMSMYYAKQQPQQPQPPRSQSSAEAEWQHFVMDPYNDRAKFDMHTSPSQLHLGPVGERDSGVYWCRVDYRWTRTTISKVRLNVLGSFPQLLDLNNCHTRVLHSHSCAPCIRKVINFVCLKQKFGATCKVYQLE